MTPHRFDNARVTVMGLGRFGGGLGVTRWLADRGAIVTVTDLESEDRLLEPIEALRPLIDAGRVRLALGGHAESDFTGTDLVVANPAVPAPWENLFLNAATRAGVPITTEIRLVCERLDRSRVIGITGSAGKSTTSAMIAHALRALTGPARLGGNIGGSLLAEVDAIGPAEWTVLEFSSAQLHWLGAGAGNPGAPAWSPAVAVITGFAPNHLDWHRTMDHYRASKQHILAGDGAAVFAGETSRAVFDAGCRCVSVAPDAPRPVLAIPGAHNRRNALTAGEAVRAAIGADIAATLDAVRDFAGLPHRLQLVAEARGVRAFNDSKSTTPESAALAIAAFDEPTECGAARVRLVCGGYDKRVDLAPMVGPGARCAAAYCVGATGNTLVRAITQAGGKATRHATVADATEAAVRDAVGGGGGVVVLSPGCASWDQFQNYEARGDAFARAAREGLGATVGG